jgi:hypothetical protein
MKKKFKFKTVSLSYADKNPSTIFPHFEISFLLFLFCRNPESLNLPPTVVPDNWEVPHSCLKVGRVLGSGAFGQVLKGFLIFFADNGPINSDQFNNLPNISS